MEQDYNGWTNRETWAVALWINNEERLYNQAQDLVQEARECQDNDALNCLSDALENFIYDFFDDEWENFKAMRNDIGSLWRVNWREIAESFLSEVEVSA